MQQYIDIINSMPLHITNLLNEKYSDDNFTYIMSREKLQTKINEMCNTLHHPITIINLNYDDNDSINIKSRIDSTASTYAIRKSCWNLRTFIGEHYCAHCDYYHAKMCQKMITNKDNTFEIPSYFSNEYIQPLKQECNGIEYIQYNCPILGFSELCFPIRFKNEIIGVLFIGEFLLENCKDKISNIQANFFEKNKYLFNDYTEQWKIYNRNDTEPPYLEMLRFDLTDKSKLAENILNRNFVIPKVNSMDEQSLESFQKLIYDITKEIKTFENEILELWDEKQRRVLPRMVDNLRANFDDLYNKTCDKDEITYTDVQNLFREICEYIVKIKNEFDFSYCRIFENLPIVQTQVILQETSGSGYCPYENLQCNFKKCTLRISKCKHSDSPSNDNNPIKCFSNNGKAIDPTSNIVFACKNIAVIFGIKNRHSNFNVLIESISNSIQHLCGDIEYIASTFTRIHHESTLRMYKHECDHLAVRIEHNNKYYENRDRYNTLSDEKHKKIFSDIKSTAILLQHLSTNIGLIQGTINLNNIKEPLRYVDIRDEFNKWRAMFRLELAKKNIRLFNATKPVNEGTYVLAYKSLLVQLLYNLIDNAVKYSYWGTNIRTEITQGKIIVEDFGLGINNSKQVYDLFYRAPNAKNHHLGDGIGLYSSKKITELLGVSLEHECELISQYHIPFVFEAKRRGFDLSEFNIDYDEFVKSIDDKTLNMMLIDSDYYCNKHYSRIPDKQLRTQINFPTYRVKFTINNFSFAQLSNDYGG